MTDRVSSLIVTLEKDMRIDDAQNIISAIGSIRGVYSVMPKTTDHGHLVAVQQAKCEMEQRLWNALREDKP